MIVLEFSLVVTIIYGKYQQSNENMRLYHWVMTLWFLGSWAKEKLQLFLYRLLLCELYSTSTRVPERRIGKFVKDPEDSSSLPQNGNVGTFSKTKKVLHSWLTKALAHHIPIMLKVSCKI